MCSRLCVCVCCVLLFVCVCICVCMVASYFVFLFLVLSLQPSPLEAQIVCSAESLLVYTTAPPSNCLTPQCYPVQISPFSIQRIPLPTFSTTLSLIHCTTLHHTAPHCTALRHTAPHIIDPQARVLNNCFK